MAETVVNNNTPESLSAAELDLIKTVRSLPPKVSWQQASNWTASCMRGALVVAFSGTNGGIIFVDKKSIDTIFKSIEAEHYASAKGRITYNFQVGTAESHILRGLERNKKDKKEENRVSFKFIRVNYSANTALLYQNVWNVVSNKDIGTKVQSTGISLDLKEDLLGCLKHISGSSQAHKEDIGEGYNDEDDV